MQDISIIVAAADNNVIGATIDGKPTIPWKLSGDFKRFKALTTGHHLIMGRRTYESIGKPLPSRTTVVLSRNYSAEGILVAHSIDQALQMASGDPEVFICGGQEVYEDMLDRATKIYLTRVHTTPADGSAFHPVGGDTFFHYDPSKHAKQWRLVNSERHEADEKNQYPFTFMDYVRAA